MTVICNNTVSNVNIKSLEFQTIYEVDTFVEVNKLTAVEKQRQLKELQSKDAKIKIIKEWKR